MSSTLLEESEQDSPVVPNASGCFPFLPWVSVEAHGSTLNSSESTVHDSTDSLPSLGSTDHGSPLSEDRPLFSASSVLKDHQPPPLLRELSSDIVSTTLKSERRGDGTSNDKGRSAVNGKAKVFILLILLVAVYVLIAKFQGGNEYFTDSCVFVSGGGFSGFYYLLGRLASQRRNLPHDQEFVCYSAGCLSVAAFLMKQSGEQAVAFGLDAQNRYLEGTNPWLQATEQMIHNMLAHYRPTSRPRFLRRMTIMTTTYDAGLWPQLVLRKPATVGELQEMLLQTSWIPFLTGFGWTKRGHNDAVFMVLHHPSCPRTVAIPNNGDIYLNAANVIMPATRAEQFHDRGVNDGLRQVNTN